MILLITHLLLWFNLNNTAPALHIEKQGQGQAVLFLPGFTNPGSIWEETASNTIPGKTYYYVSYAGFNGLDPIDTPWYDQLKEQLLRYVIDNDLKDLIIVGHSMGGNLAIDLAAELPNRIDKMILVDALPCMREVMMPQIPAESLSYHSPYNTQMLQMESTQFNTMAASMAVNMTYKVDKQKQIAEWIQKADRKTWVYGYTDLLKLDQRTILSKINCPTLILGADFPNRQQVEQNFYKQYQNLQNKKLVIAPNSKHFVFFDQPEWFGSQIQQFLNDAP